MPPFDKARYEKWRQGVGFTDEEIARALEADAMDTPVPFLKTRYLYLAEKARRGFVSRMMIIQTLPRLITHCGICGKKALYRTANEGRCSTHRYIPARPAQERDARLEARQASFEAEAEDKNHRLMKREKLANLARVKKARRK